MAENSSLPPSLRHVLTLIALAIRFPAYRQAGGHQALHHLGEITGEITTDDLLENIFSKFCIGKYPDKLMCKVQIVY